MAHSGAETTTTVTGRGRVTALALFALIALTLTWPAAEAASATEDAGAPMPPADPALLETPPATVPREPAAPEPDEVVPAVEAPPEEVVASPDAVVPPVELPPEEVVASPDAVVPAVEVPPEQVVAPPTPAVPAVLDVTPESSSSLTGSDHVLTAAVTDAAGNGVPGAVDFEVVKGPADNDVGTPGDTPLSPDLGCVAAGGGPGVAATCTVAYAENANQQGGDRVLAWIDHDGDDVTVEADVAEGRSHTPCVAEHGDPGKTPEPDGTDCVTHSWTSRAPTAVDVTNDLAANVPGVSQPLEAVIVDQGGEVLHGVDTPTTVSFYFLAGSVHHPSASTKTSGRPDLVCRTDATGRCTANYPGTVRGVDTVCAVIQGAGSQCGEPVDAPDADNKADVVAVAWVGGRLDVDKESSSSLSGTEHVLTARVVDGAGAAMTNIDVDFEVLSGPGEDDVGGDGDSPESPDLGCVTGAGEGDAGTCRVAYTDDDNESGIDAVLAWVDFDRSDATVEADRAEGESGEGAGRSGCVVGTSGIGSTAEPDDTDCVTRSWSARVATSVDVSPEAATLSPGDAHRLDAVVRDQDGTPIVAPTEVRFSFLPGSATSSEHLTCTTRADGSCAVTWSGRVEGTDTVCGALAGAVSGCGESTGALERADGADVVSVTWGGPRRGQPVDGESGGTSPDGASPDDASLAARRSGAAGSGADARPGSTVAAAPSAPERFARELAKRAPFPVALMVVIAMFLWFQNRIDRKDPKLGAALLDGEMRRFE